MILQEEQESILRGKEKSEEMGLNWSDTKDMPVTFRVIQETLRIASILSFTFREAVEDLELQGQKPNLIRYPLCFYFYLIYQRNPFLSFPSCNFV